MLGLIVLIVSIAAIDSLNPSTLGPALYYGVGRRARRDVAAFAVGVFTVSTVAGLVLMFGPGQLLLRVLSKPRPHALHVVELGAGVVAVAVAVVLWLVRHRVASRVRRGMSGDGRSALLLGGGIIAVELPTALPYFAAIASILASGRSTVTEITLLLLFNAVFAAPLLLLLALVTFGGTRGARIAEAARAKLDRWAPVLLPAVVAVVGAALVLAGAVGLAQE
jgi:cytochrome c biogenesis protein CcdA